MKQADNLVWVRQYSSSGRPYRTLESTRMLAIPPQVLNCCVYIYASMNDAKAGEHSGGSGFLVGVSLTENKTWRQIYVVTALHVIDKMPNPVLRLNLMNGKFDPLETNRGRWKEHGDGDDLAVYPLELESIDDYRLWLVEAEGFLNESRGRIIYPGDEVFMIGRFISHEGKQQNIPSVRFGNISMMPTEPIAGLRGHPQEAFLVEQRSLPGYSGSPVFVFIDPTLPRPPGYVTPSMPVYRIEHHGPWLLGVDVLHINDYDAVLGEDKETTVTPKRWVKAHTGMAAVIPAWRLMDLLNTEELVMQRKKDDEEITRGKKASHVTFDSASTEESFTKEDFENALKQVSRRIQPSQSGEEK